MGNRAIVKDLRTFLRMHKKWWLLPILAILMLMLGLAVMTEGSVIKPFIYALF